MSDFDIEISSDEDEDFITNFNIVGNIKENPVYTAGNTQHDMTEGEDDEIEDTIVTEGLISFKCVKGRHFKEHGLQFNTKIY